MRIGAETIRLDVPSPLLAFERYTADDRISVTVNLGLEERRIALEKPPVFAPVGVEEVLWEAGHLHLPGLSFAAFRAGE